MKKSVISLIAYDAHMLKNSIASYYDYVDEIILGLDEDRISWSNNRFTFDENKTWSELSKLDGDNKIKIVEKNFHPSDTPIENDNYERNVLKSYASNPVIISIDADEELVNPRSFFVEYLPLYLPYVNKADLLFTWFLPYKLVSDNEGNEYYLVIANNDNSFFKGDTQGFVTNKNSTYTYCRWTDIRKFALSPAAIMHWSFCRSEKEVNEKLSNYGHSNIKNEDPFFDVWKQITFDNFSQLHNFKTSGFGDNQWEKLIAIPKNQIYDVARNEANKII